MSNNPITNNIFNSIYRVTKEIPEGKVSTYGEIARFLKINSRTVGWALHANKDLKVPCHRVVNREGKIAKNYGFGGEGEQRRRLEDEGIEFNDNLHVNILKYLYKFQ